jgi:signal transduction histidine kinase
MMSGLSGAEFVLLDQRELLAASTLQLDADDLAQLRRMRADEPSSRLAGRPAIMLGGRSYLCQRVPVAQRDPLRRAGSLVVLYPEDRWSAVMREAAYSAIIAGGLATIAIILVTTVLSQRFVRPIRRLGNRAAAIAEGDFSQGPMEVWRHDDEIRDLAVSIDQMSEQLGQYEVQVRRHEQIRTLDRLGAGMAHQLRNAATGGRMAIELHQRECAVGPTSESLGVALRQLRLMESYLQRFLGLGRDQPLAAEDVDLSTVVEDVLSLMRPACAHANIDLQFISPTSSFHVQGDAEALRQLTVNLVTNAVEATSSRTDESRQAGAGEMPDDLASKTGERPRITIALEALGEDRAALHVCDTGPGPSPDVTDRLFEPFVSEKPEGTGLGLYVVRQLAEAHHGLVRWQRREDTTCFTVEFPRLA